MQRDFTVTHPNAKWVADLTYIRTWNGLAYLAFILDCYSRMIVGSQLATHMRTELVLDALEMANGLRRPDGNLIAHSDRGSQYKPDLHRPPRQLEIDPSVGSKGDAYDNAMVEAWVATFKSELVDGRRYPHRAYRLNYKRDNTNTLSTRQQSVQQTQGGISAGPEHPCKRRSFHRVCAGVCSMQATFELYVVRVAFCLAGCYRVP